MIARHTGFWDVALYRIMVLAIAAGSLVFSAGIALRLYSDRPVAGGTLLIAAAFAFTLLDTLQFGQREHITLILLLPYVLLAACRASAMPVARRVGFAAGVMAGVALAFKPHFVFAWLGVEAFIHLARRRERGDPASRMPIGLRRPETAGIVAAVVACAVAVVVLTPDFFRFAMYTAQTYGGYGGTSRWLLITRLADTRTIAALSIAALLLPPSARCSRDRTVSVPRARPHAGRREVPVRIRRGRPRRIAAHAHHRGPTAALRSLRLQLLAYFGQDPAFRQLLQEYRPVAVVERYLVVRRVTGSPVTSTPISGP